MFLSDILFVQFFSLIYKIWFDSNCRTNYKVIYSQCILHHHKVKSQFPFLPVNFKIKYNMGTNYFVSIVN